MENSCLCLKTPLGYFISRTDFVDLLQEKDNPDFNELVKQLSAVGEPKDIEEGQTGDLELNVSNSKTKEKTVIKIGFCFTELGVCLRASDLIGFIFSFLMPIPSLASAIEPIVRMLDSVELVGPYEDFEGN